MKFINYFNTGDIVKDIIGRYVKANQVVMDCTMGNGYDTLALSNAVGDKGKVYSFDVQTIALENTRKLLKLNNAIDNCQLILDSHENIDKYISQKLNFIIYNLGFLPKGDKSIKTTSTSSLISIKKALELLDSNGLLVVTVYPGHEGGREEKEAIEQLFISLDQKKFNVIKFDFINQANNPPLLFCIEKSK